MDSISRRGFVATGLALLGARRLTAQDAPAAEPGAGEAPAARPAVVLGDAARKLHAAALVIDGHNDLPGEIRKKGSALDLSQAQPELDTDIPRLRAGGLGGQFWSAYVPAETMRTGGAARQTLEQIDIIYRMVERYPDTFQLARTADDIERSRAEGKIASLIGLEGGHSIEDSLGVLRDFARLGARYMTLTHSDTLAWADAATDAAKHGGLTSFGVEVVQEMNRLGMLVDISHVSVETMHDALRASRAPVIASHSSAYSIAAHPRNVPDEILREVARNGGVVMVNFFSGFVVPAGAVVMARMFDVGRELKAKHPNPADFEQAMKQWHQEHPIPAGTIHDVVDHIDHIAKVAGVDHVGLGSDYDGVTKLPAQLEDVSCYPLITQELLNRGYSAEAIHKILGQNVLRALRQAEEVARGS
ncbi:MAG: dipeptidase [Planctomycetaceae bacterium]|nr:dipeptidase [Planctomycetaceae bacterium]